MNHAPFRPIGDRYLVVPDPIQSKSQSIDGTNYTVEGETSVQEKSVSGQVVARATKCREFKVGDRVCFTKYSGVVLGDGETEYLILQETEILAQDLRPAPMSPVRAVYPIDELIETVIEPVPTQEHAPDAAIGVADDAISDDDIPW